MEGKRKTDWKRGKDEGWEAGKVILEHSSRNISYQCRVPDELKGVEGREKID